MNIPELQNLLGSPIDEAPTSRREALRKTGKLGAGLALAALPAAVLPKVSFAQEGPSAIDILNYALTLEFLEAIFYEQGVESGVIPSGEDTGVFELIAQHEDDHVDFLTSVITDNNLGEPVSFTADDFNFNVFGLDPFNNYAHFLLLSMGFEDTGVRAYKGQAPYLVGTPYLTPALQIHALEARHAAEVRRLRAQQGVDLAPWILGDSSQAYPDPLAPVYDGAPAPMGFPEDQFFPEENTFHAGIELTDVEALNDIAVVELAASFDEALGMETVNSIAGNFFADNSA